jgi:hypothetical protein
MYMKNYDLKKLFLEDRPLLNQYLTKIDFSLNQVISIESLDLDSEGLPFNGLIRRAYPPVTRRFVFRGMGFVFSVDTNDEYSFFKPELKFNEIQLESQAG